MNYEIYTLAQLRHFYEEISANGETNSTLRCIDLKNKLMEFMKSRQSSTSNTSEFVMSADESVLPNWLSAVSLGREGGMQKSFLVKNCGKVVSAEIQDRLTKEKRERPPTPHRHTRREKH